MKKIIPAVLVLLFPLSLLVTEDVSAAPECSPSDLKNGSFETPDTGATLHTYSAGETFDGWIVDSGSVDLAKDFWKNASGRQSVDLEGSLVGGMTPQRIYQDVQVTSGAPYKLRFAVSANSDHTPGLIKHMNVFWEGAKIATISEEVKPRPEMSYTYYAHSVTATGSTARLAFESADFPTSSYGVALDDISLSCVSIGLVSCGGTDQPACTLCDIFVLIQNILNIFLFPIVPIIAALLFAIGGFLLFTAAGNPTNLGKAKTIFFATIIGLLIVYGAYLFISFLLQAMGVASWTGLGTWWKITC